MDQERLVCEGRGLSKVKYAVQMAKSTILHEMEEYLYHTLQKLAIRKILHTWRSDRRGNNYFQIKFLTVGVGGGLTGPGGGQTAIYTRAGGLTGHPWRSDRPGTGVGGLIGPWCRSDCYGLFRPPKIYFSAKDFLRFSTDSNLEITQKSLRAKKRNGGAHSEFWTTFS
jgi:hypothetical protein